MGALQIRPGTVDDAEGVAALHLLTAVGGFGPNEGHHGIRYQPMCRSTGAP